MKITLRNSIGGELQTWSTEFDMADDIRHGRVLLADGDKIEVSDVAEDAMEDFNYVGSRHHY